MPIATDGMRQIVANGYTAAAIAGSLHTADPGTTGAAEAAWAGYARKGLTWTAGTTGTGTASATFDVAAGGAPTWGGIWNQVATGGIYRDKVDIVDQTFASAGTLTISYTYTQT